MTAIEIRPQEREQYNKYGSDDSFEPMPEYVPLQKGEFTLAELQKKDGLPDPHGYDERHFLRRRRELQQDEDDHRHFKRTKLLAKKAMVLATAPLIIGSQIGTSIANEYQEWSEERGEIIQIDEAYDPKNNDTLAIGFVGFGNSDATNMMENLQSLREVAQTAAVEYPSSGISTDAIAEEVVEYIEENNVKEVIFTGHSIGGLVALNTMAKVKEITDEQYLSVQARYAALFQTPYSLDSVRSNMRFFGEKVCSYAQYAPWLKYWWPARFIPEYLARKQQFTDDDGWIEPRRAFEVGVKVYDDKIEDPSATTNILYDQFCVQLGATATGAMKRISEASSEPYEVTIDYYSPYDGTTDRVVDKTKSIPRFSEAAKDNDLVLNTWNMADIGHHSPGQDPEVFNAMITSTLIPEIKAAKAQDALERECGRAALFGAHSKSLCREITGGN